MKVEKIFSDVVLISIEAYEDSRGYFKENYNKRDFKALGVEGDFIQDNLSFSLKKGTIRGLHFQKEPYQQSKIVYVLAGKILDVFVDIRPESKDYGKYGSVELTNSSGCIYIPSGFAHGFCTLENDTIISYKVDNLYSPEYDSGILWNDKDLNIN